MSWYDNPVGALSGFLGQQVPIQPGGATGINTQTAMDQGEAQRLQNQQLQLQQQQQQTYAGQNQLAGTLQNTITNPNAPSVAMSQLGSGFNQIAGTQMAGAAGASGENAAMAKRAAMQNIAGTQTGLNAQQAQLHAQEVANAQTGLSNLYSTQLGSQNTGQGNDISGATSLAGTTMQGQSTIANNNEKASEANAKANSNLLGTLGGAASSIAGMF
jgi:hypothetical protein